MKENKAKVCWFLCEILQLSKEFQLPKHMDVIFMKTLPKLICLPLISYH